MLSILVLRLTRKDGEGAYTKEEFQRYGHILGNIRGRKHDKKKRILGLVCS
jgi:hypothetical protein